MVLGILAHVDAGKTTLSEALLYEAGKIRSVGRVDHQDAFLDTDSQERERGITIFSKQAQLDCDGMKITLLDTPGHVDFSAEMERTLQVLDYAILVISGTDGVQGHTKTLWRLLQHYQIPTFLFINKMDLQGASQEKIQKQLKNQLSDACVDFSDLDYEEIAMCSENMLDYYMEHETIEKEQVAEAIRKRLLFPCFYGSALKLEGVKELFDGIKTFAQGAYERALFDKNQKEEAFGALVYKIGRDARGARLTHLKVTSGSLRVKDKVSYNGLEEKIDQIRIYSGEKFEVADMIREGEICTVTGLDQTYPGM